MDPVVTFTSPLARCEYLPDRLSQLYCESHPRMLPEEYMRLLQSGWRRFGRIVFRPDCPSCQMCRSLRVPTQSFRPSESQRRAWKQNAGELTIRIGNPSFSPDKQALFARFHEYGRAAKGWPETSEGQFELFLANPFRTEEWCYYRDDRLIALGYVDALAEGLSAIYFCWDPAERRRSLGTFNVMAMIASARDRRLPHVYLGYFVAGCRSLEYKARFRPNEVVTPAGAWEPFVP